MCHAYFMVSEKNFDKVCVCMHFTMHTIFMYIGMCFPWPKCVSQVLWGARLSNDKEHFNLNKEQSQFWIIHVNAENYS